MTKLKSNLKLEGSNRKGWRVTISDNYGYKEDFALLTEELLELKKLITKKVK